MNDYPILIAIIVLIAATIQSFSGFGFAIISVSLISIFFNIKPIIPLISLCGLLLNLILFLELRKNIDFKSLINLYIGSFIGIPIGINFYIIADVKIIKIILALIVIFFVVINAIKTIHLKKKFKFVEILVGFFAGFLGGAINTNGPPVLLYQKIIPQSNINFKAAIIGYFVINSILIVSYQIFTKITTITVFYNFLKIAPLIIIAYFMGNYLFKKFSAVFFNKIILFLLFLIAFILIYTI